MLLGKNSKVIDGISGLDDLKNGTGFNIMSGMITSLVLVFFIGVMTPVFADKDQRGNMAPPVDQEGKAKPQQLQPNVNNVRRLKSQKLIKPIAPQKQVPQHVDPLRQYQSKQQDNSLIQQRSNSRKQIFNPLIPQQHMAHGETQNFNPPSPQTRNIKNAGQWEIWNNRRANNWQNDHKSWQFRGGYDGYRIPNGNFDVSFGHNHRFIIFSHSVVVFGGFPRFYYHGYWFNIIDPIPEYWDENWYENDEVFVDYADDGYYLCNSRYLSDKIAIRVSLN